MRLSSLLSFALCSLAASTAFAQPEPHSRCHHAQNYAPMPALTAEQQLRMKASVERSDSFDLLHHNIHLDILNFTTQIIGGHCVVKFTPKINGLTTLPLDLLDFTIDSIVMNSQVLAYNYNSRDYYVIKY